MCAPLFIVALTIGATPADSAIAATVTTSVARAAAWTSSVADAAPSSTSTASDDVGAGGDGEDDEPPRLGLDGLVLPIVQFNDDAGFIYGIHVPLIDYGDGTARPYRWAVELKLRHSTRNRHEHYLWADLPDVAGLRLTLRGTYLRIADANYFGVARTELLAEPRQRFYQYLLDEPRIQLVASRRFLGEFLWGVGVSFSATSTEYLESSLLAAERPLGADGGRALFLLGTLAWDTRDDELVPTRGVYVELYAKGAVEGLGSSFGLGGAGLAVQGYTSPLHRFVLAGRVLAESLTGDVPFYELGRIGGSTNVFGLGGVFTQRGFLESRFLGRHKVLSNLEARQYFPSFFRRRVTLGLAAFFDASLVLDGAEAADLLPRIRPSGGGALLVKWKELVLFRVDAGVSAEGTLLYVEGRHLF
ncbi:outer membrane protein assembly factor [Myxococcota bacterium]|nr:outer membrane protein assembly factor [Myxococcota bacterium]